MFVVERYVQDSLPCSVLSGIIIHHERHEDCEEKNSFIVIAEDCGVLLGDMVFCVKIDSEWHGAGC